MGDIGVAGRVVISFQSHDTVERRWLAGVEAKVVWSAVTIRSTLVAREEDRFFFFLFLWVLYFCLSERHSIAMGVEGLFDSRKL